MLVKEGARYWKLKDPNFVGSNLVIKRVTAGKKHVFFSYLIAKFNIKIKSLSDWQIAQIKTFFF